jgi:hypothetical protein
MISALDGGLNILGTIPMMMRFVNDVLGTVAGDRKPRC